MLPPLSRVIVCVLLLVSATRLAAETVNEDGFSWLRYDFTYEWNGKSRSNSVRFAADIGPGMPLRGFLKRGWAAGNGAGEIHALAHAQHLAQFDAFDDNSVGATAWNKGPVQAMLDAAALASGHAELVHAGCIIQGLSNGGRGAARWAALHPERTIAVVLDHSWAPYAPNDDLPLVPGVPMFFQATYSDTYQDADRRYAHYRWTSYAFQDKGQPCTTTIHTADSGNTHSDSGTRELHAAWLEDVLLLRVPATIPTDGSAMDLLPVDIQGEAVVVMTLAKEGARHYHDQVRVVDWGTLARDGDPQELARFWMPGPRSAAIYVDWTIRNGGSASLEYRPHEPVARAGDDRAILPGDAILLDGSTSFDPDDMPAPLRFGWRQLSGPTVTLAEPDAAITTFAPRTQLGTYVFELEVDDGEHQNTDTVEIRISDLRPHTAVLAGSTWRYRSSHQAPPSDWSSPDFDDAAWPAGPAELGYGDGDEATTVPFGSDGNDKPIATQFRHTFTIADPHRHSNLLLHLKRDDGAVVWLNGIEVVRSNMPAGPLTHTTTASAATSDAAELLWHEYELDTALLRAGRNTLAIAVHQIFAHTADLSFDAELTSEVAQSPTTQRAVRVRVEPAPSMLRIHTADPQQSHLGTQATLLGESDTQLVIHFSIGSNG